MKILGSIVMFLAAASFALAIDDGTSNTILVGEVPEIDGSSIATGIALVSGALMVARGRRK